MDPVIAFLMEHWQLSLGFILVLVLLLVNEWRHRVFGLKQVSPQECVNMLNHDGAIAVDVRATAQFEQGHIVDALNIPLVTFEQSLSQLEKYKTKPLILVCASGLDSTKAVKILKTAGFSLIYGLEGGIQAWTSQQLPLVR